MRFLAFLAMLVFAGTVVRAAPATRPTPEAAARAANLVKNVKTFQLHLNYHGEQDKPYYDLLLSVVPISVAGANPFSPAVAITPAQAKTIIAHLTGDGFLDRATDISNKKLLPPDAPCYTLLVRYEDGNDRPEFYERLGWGRPLLHRLDSLRGVFDGDAAKAMDLLLGRLSGHRKEWERQAMTQLAGPDAIDRLAARLSADPLWGNGGSPAIALPSDAPMADVVAKVFALTTFDAGRVTRHTLRITRDVRIGNGPSDVYTAVLVATDLGDKIVLLRSGGREGRWWSRVFDADPPVAVQAATSRPALPAFEIKCRKPDDAVQVSTEGGKAVFDITSGSGIGGATVERAAGHWPDEVVLRLHLKGLESLRLAGGGSSLGVSVVSHSGNPRLLHLKRGDEPEGPELAKGEPGWTDVRAMDAKGKPADGLPGEGGWFELTVPRVVLSDESKTLTLDWIDFYRR